MHTEIECDSNTTQVPYLGIECHDMPMENVIEYLLREGKGKLCTVVTPNVDHILRLNRNDSIEFHQAYSKATLILNDSKVVKFISDVFKLGVKNVVPGSDLVEQILATVSGYDVLLIGPDKSSIEILEDKYPTNRYTVTSPAHGFYSNSKTVERIIDMAIDTKYDLVLFCLGSPVSEYLMSAMNEKRTSGVAICCGASIDFIVGKQLRAPIYLRSLGLEWVFRACKHPVRLGPRYLNNIIRFPILITRRMISGTLRRRDCW